MRHAYGEVLADAVKRQHSAQQVVGGLLKVEIDEKRARSIGYKMTIAKLPLAKVIASVNVTNTFINEALVRELADGGFLASQRNAVLAGGTGTGRTHLAIAIGRASVRSGARVRFYTTINLVNPARGGGPCRQARTRRRDLSRVNLVMLEKVGYLPFALSDGQLRTLSASSRGIPLSWSPPTSRSATRR